MWTSGLNMDTWAGHSSRQDMGICPKKGHMDGPQTHGT